MGIQCVEARHDGKHHTMFRTAPATITVRLKMSVVLRLRNLAINILELCSGTQLSFLEIV